MSNHVHLIAVPDRPESLAVLFRRVHGRYAQMVNARRGRSGHLWQNRYYSCALSPGHLRRALVYVERNPIRAGIAGRVEDYKWSSAAAHLGLARDRYGILDREFWEYCGGVAGWREIHGMAEDEAELRLLRRCTYAGRPYGEEEYVAVFEQHFQRVWRKWGFEKETEERVTFAV